MCYVLFDLFVMNEQSQGLSDKEVMVLEKMFY